MNIQEFLSQQQKFLYSHNIGTARLDCLILFEDVLHKSRSWILAHSDQELSSSTIRVITSLINRRALHEPLAYIRGKSEFFGREFIVNKHTLEPRPETETMISTALELLHTRKPMVLVDVGTGSGCIGITMKLELPQYTVIATDIDPHCIETATKNAKHHDAEIKFYKAPLLTPLTNIHNSNDRNKCEYVVMANLPYVPDKYQINEAATFEPRHAIFGGEDGLDLYRELFYQLHSSDLAAPFVLTESLPFQHEELKKIADLNGYVLEKTDDFIQLFRSVAQPRA